MEDLSQHGPYVHYCNTVKYIDDFVQISELSYGITKQLMKRHNKDSLGDVELPKPKIKSYLSAWLTSN